MRRSGRCSGRGGARFQPSPRGGPVSPPRRCPRPRAAFSTPSTHSIRYSSTSPPGNAKRWTPGIACCSRRPGPPSKTPDTTRPIGAAPSMAFSLASKNRITPSICSPPLPRCMAALRRHASGIFWIPKALAGAQHGVLLLAGRRSLRVQEHPRWRE